MEMNPQDDDKPATQGMVRATQGMVRATQGMVRATQGKVRATQGMIRDLGAELRSEIGSSEAKLREEMVSKTMFQTAMISLTKSISDLGDTLTKRMEKLEQHVTGTLQDFAGKLEIYKNETQTLPETVDQHGKLLRQHENRIGELETWRKTAGG